MSYQEGAWEGSTPDESVSAWSVGAVIFAGTMMIVAGMFQVFEGLAAVIQDDFFVLDRAYAFDMSVSTWGWLHMVTGTLLAAAGVFIFTGVLWARILGIVLAVISMITNFFYIPYYPVWSILIIGVDMLIIWGLASFPKGGMENNT